METDQGVRAAYLRRMRALQRSQRVVNLICVFLALYAVITAWRNPGLMDAAPSMLVWSLLAFIGAFVVAINVLTVRFGSRTVHPRR